MLRLQNESIGDARYGDSPDGLLRLDYPSPADGTHDWALMLPPARGNTWVVVIHGHGSDGSQLYTRKDVTDAFLPGFLDQGLGVLTPNLRGNAWMSPAAGQDLAALLQYLREKHQAGRFLLAGGSMGGTSNLIYAALHPEDISGVVALCPATDLASYCEWCSRCQSGVLREIHDAIELAYGGSPSAGPDVYSQHSALLRADRLRMPVAIVHGAADEIIPVSHSRRLVGAMADSDSLLYIEIPDGDHESPIQRFSEAVQWVLDAVK